MQHRIPGLPPTDLLSYLVGLGLGRAISRQAPGRTEWAWDGDGHGDGDAFIIDTEAQDLAAFLVNDYRPVPILSPWNNGSGFAPQDKNQRANLNKLLDAGDRMTDWREADAIGRRLVAQQTSPNWTKDRKAKERVIRQLRNLWPDEALDWLDAAVVLTTEGAEFPPLLGSGGNDGRLDFSANFHTNLLAVLPEAGASRKQSLAWANALLQGGTHAGQLISRPIGQFDASGAGTPRSGAFGGGRALLNPWAFVLMVDGALLFAAAPARRLGETFGRAALPFTVFGSPDGPTPGSPVEDFRGELWVPVWSTPSRLDEVEQVFSEARATWDGSTAVQAAQMYGAVRSFGADRRIDRFIRFGLAKRNGLAYVAIPLDEVRTDAVPGIELAIPITHRARPLHSLRSNALDVARRNTERRLTDYLRRTRPEDLLLVLEALTRWELAVTRSAAGRESGLHLPAKVPARQVMPRLAPLISAFPELRVAASLSSGTTRTSSGLVTTRQIVMGNIPDLYDRGWKDAAVRGLGARPLVDVLCDAAVWCEQHGALSGGGADLQGHGVRVATHHTFRSRTWQDVHSWTRGDLDDQYLEMAFLALLALDWRSEASSPMLAVPQAAARPPLPELAILQGFNSGAVRLPDDSTAEPRIQGLQQGWLLRLRADRTQTVMDEATALLNRSRLTRAAPDGSTWTTTDVACLPPIPTVNGRRLAAAMMAASTAAPLRKLVIPSDAKESHDIITDSSITTGGTR